MVGEERPAERIWPRRVELAEVAAEGEHLRVGELLAAEADHQVLQPGFADFSERRCGQRPGEIKAADFGAERAADFLHVKQGRGSPVDGRRPASRCRCGWILGEAPGPRSRKYSRSSTAFRRRRDGRWPGAACRG